MKGYFNSSKEPNAIIAKEDVLMPDFIPTEALHRTNEMNAIADAINPMIYGNKCDNLFIFGPSGTGKTTCMKILIEQLNDSSAKVIPVYANCWEYATKMAIYYKICEALKIMLPRRGLASDEVFERILEVMRKDKISILLILDELDSLVFNKEESILYIISRAGEKGGINFGLVGISNKHDLTRLLDDRTSSSLRFTNFEFKEYNVEQIEEILLERAKRALIPNTYDKSILKECALIASENNGSARLALEILWKAAVRADRRDAKKIETEDVEEITKIIERRPSKRSYKSVSFEEFDLKLSEEEKTILDILAEGEKPSSDLYNAFTAKLNKSKRQIRNYLMTLEAKGLIDSKEIEYRENSFLKTKIYFIKKRGVE